MLVNVIHLCTRTFRDSLHFAPKLVKNLDYLILKNRKLQIHFKIKVSEKGVWPGYCWIFLNNFPKRFYSNCTFFFFFKTNSIFNFSLMLPSKICEFKLKVAKKLLHILPKKTYKNRNFLKFGLNCFTFLIAALIVAKDSFAFGPYLSPSS